MDNTAATLPIEYLLEIVLKEILSMLKYHEVAMFRRINRKFNNICTSLLNKGYKSAKLHHTIRHQDVLTTIERRLSILDKTFLRYYSLNLCCFIPEKSLTVCYQYFRQYKMKEDPNATIESVNA